MLPSLLLITKRNKERIRPAYVSASEDFIQLARSLIEIYRKGIGLKRSRLREEVRQFEDAPHNFRLVRGLEVLLDRISTFQVDSPVDPYVLRKTVFSLSNGFTADPSERARILESASKGFKISASDVEKYLWSDLEDEEILKTFGDLEPEDLLASYNLSITQTLLFKATSLEFTVKQNWKNIFKAIKYLGLMYSISRRGDEYVISVEGPVALLKLTERYGTNLAKLLPELLAGGEWALRAQIVSRWQEESRLSIFDLKSSEGILFPRATPEPAEEYDSSVERSFARRFSAIGSRWRLLREPELLPVGIGVMIPDFAFELGRKRVFFEIVGFWTQEYLKRKLSKLEAAGNVDMIVAVDSSLGISKHISGKVILFDGEVPLKPVLEYLERAEAGVMNDELERAMSMQLNLDEPCVGLGDLSSKLSLSKDALKKRLAAVPISGYTLIGDCLIREDKLGSLEKIVESERPLGALVAKLEAEGIGDPFPLINFFGFRVFWNGLASEQADIQKEAGKGRRAPTV
jgi:hypothetical protein